MNLYLDIETVPTQSESIRDELARPLLEKAKAKSEEIDAKIAAIAPPANYKSAEAIARWEAEDKPKKIAALEAERESFAQQIAVLVDDAWLKTSFDGALGHVVVIGAAIDDGEPHLFYSGEWLKNEADVIAQFYFWLEREIPDVQRLNTCFIGHNVIDFDLRFLFQRSVVHALHPPRFIPFTARPWGDRVYDTMTAWTGGRDRVSLDKLCRVLGIAGKGTEIGEDIDGSKVWDFIRAGRIAEVASYCAGDVRRVREVHRRMTFSRAA